MKLDISISFDLVKVTADREVQGGTEERDVHSTLIGPKTLTLFAAPALCLNHPKGATASFYFSFGHLVPFLFN